MKHRDRTRHARHTHHPCHICQTEMDSPLGRILIARNAHGLSGLWFEGQKYHPGVLAVPRDDHDPLLARTVQALHAYFDGQALQLPALAPQGTPFQQAVWQWLLDIPAGATWTYGQLAARVGRPEAVRAVAAAVGRNPLSILVPCHRVIGANGQLTGYAGGLDRKRALLALEAALEALDAPGARREAQSPTLAEPVQDRSAAPARGVMANNQAPRAPQGASA
ncbi:methylated-DNA-[protein]-cysteine S-methyltransferase [Roseateles sp. YR242]|uniref:methylated-DNA--[protein]-cysteine S-methyltransferase n=1 Tax=Roseateles sp. YR242 TaxID=1855305 RepID=UPI0008C99BE0|nr:methylated-DNA--[protein]-cysteine S-methyltransferase [Roseateles sp. YR242]SEL08386.1 methylated-DNA-[protein]-cysteine S-methyltransferase [Roseateles sp. YR242]